MKDLEQLVKVAAALAITVAIAACQTVPQPEPVISAGPSWTDDWHAFVLPGKRKTRYLPMHHDGRWVLHARADRSASVHRRKLHLNPDELAGLSFSWKVCSLVAGGDVRDASVEDAPARMLLAFDGDTRRLSARTRMQFDLMESLSGEAPPYATLMYVWDRLAPVDTLVVNKRSDRVRKIVVESGPAHLGQWRSYQRDVRADYRRAYGEEPGALIGIAVMTDTDNTQTFAEAWYGEIKLATPPGGAAQ